jgi:hypothetical protein
MLQHVAACSARLNPTTLSLSRESWRLHAYCATAHGQAWNCLCIVLSSMLGIDREEITHFLHACDDDASFVRDIAMVSVR